MAHLGVGPFRKLQRLKLNGDGTSIGTPKQGTARIYLGQNGDIRALVGISPLYIITICLRFPV